MNNSIFSLPLSTDMDDLIFVFGSNEAGRHGMGAAKFAVENHGAKYGQGVGLQGNSYGIPTKDGNLAVLKLDKINDYVQDFIKFAKENPDMKFFVTRIGCGLAGYKPIQIGPMFGNAITLKNVILDKDFQKFAETEQHCIFGKTEIQNE